MSDTKTGRGIGPSSIGWGGGATGTGPSNTSPLVDTYGLGLDEMDEIYRQEELLRRLEAGKAGQSIPAAEQGMNRQRLARMALDEMPSEGVDLGLDEMDDIYRQEEAAAKIEAGRNSFPKQRGIDKGISMKRIGQRTMEGAAYDKPISSGLVDDAARFVGRSTQRIGQIPGVKPALRMAAAGAGSLPGRIGGRVLGALGGIPGSVATDMLNPSELGDSGDTALQEHYARFGGRMDPRAIPMGQAPSYESIPIEGTMEGIPESIDFSGEQPWGEEGFNVPTRREERGKGRRKVEDTLRALRALKLGE